MYNLPSRQLLRLSRIRRFVAHYPPSRSNATRSQGDDEAAFTGWSVRSPRDILNYLSQYIVGQEKAKRTLSVAVYNHYQRITPQQSTPPPPPKTSANASSSFSGPTYTTLESRLIQQTSPSENLPTSSSSSSRRPIPDVILRDPSRAGIDLDRGVVRFTSEPDPTLTHDLITERSREGRYARGLDGYFSSILPPPPSKSPTQRRKKASTADSSTDSSGSNSERTVPSSRTPLSHGVEASDPVPNDLLKEEVIIEKSNVLMIGPTGTGKTLMAKTLARILDVPFASCDATSYTQAGYVGDDVENCVLRLLQAAEYDVNRAEVGIIHIDEIDKLARRGGGDFGSWGGGRDVGGEGVQQALLRLLEGTTLTLSAKPPPISSTTSNPSSNSPSNGSSNPPHPSPSPSSPSSSSSSQRLESTTLSGDPPIYDPRDPMSRGFGAAGNKRGVREGLPGYGGGGGGGGGSGKGETFVVDTSNILFILSGAFVGLESIVSRRLGKGSIGFGAPLPKPQNTASASSDTLPAIEPTTPDLQTYGLIPEFLGRLPILTSLSPLSLSDLIRVLTEPRNALIKQYTRLFEKYGSELRFTNEAIKELAKIGQHRGGGARGLRGVMEDVLGDSMFEVPGSSVRYCLITKAVAQKLEPALYFSRGQRHLFHQAIEDEDKPNVIVTPTAGHNEMMEEIEEGEEERLRASG